MTRTKSPLESLGVWGGGAATGVGVSMVLNYFGVGASPGDVAEAQDLVTGIITSVSGLVAIYGRVRANSTIKLPWK